MLNVLFAILTYKNNFNGKKYVYIFHFNEFFSISDSVKIKNNIIDKIYLYKEKIVQK